MMPRWVLSLPLGVVFFAVGVLGFRLGWIDVNLSETDAINAYVGRYLREAGPDARASDCVARPGDRVWLELICSGDQAVWIYQVNRFGGLIGVSGPKGSIEEDGV